RSPFLDAWEPVDLGRRTLFALRPTRGPADPTPLLTAGSLAAALGQRLDPLRPEYDERLAAAGRTVAGPSPVALGVSFAQGPLRLEALLQAPLRRESGRPGAESGEPGETGREPGGAQPAAATSSLPSPIFPQALAPRFGIQERSPERVVYRRM